MGRGGGESPDRGAVVSALFCRGRRVQNIKLKFPAQPVPFSPPPPRFQKNDIIKEMQRVFLGEIQQNETHGSWVGPGDHNTSNSLQSDAHVCLENPRYTGIQPFSPQATNCDKHKYKEHVSYYVSYLFQSVFLDAFVLF